MLAREMDRLSAQYTKEASVLVCEAAYNQLKRPNRQALRLQDMYIAATESNVGTINVLIEAIDLIAGRDCRYCAQPFERVFKRRRTPGLGSHKA